MVLISARDTVFSYSPRKMQAARVLISRPHGERFLLSSGAVICARFTPTMHFA
jgi:hypothetical protein